MRIHLGCLLFLFSLSVFSQTRITVIDSFYEDAALNDVKVLSPDRSLLGKTDNEGNFTVPEEVKEVILVLDGYVEKHLPTLGKPLTVRLNPATIELQESRIMIDEGRAKEILRRVIRNKKKNDIRNLDSYAYKSYSKFLITASTDSLPLILLPKTAADSSYNDLRTLLDNSHMMLAERAMDHKYSSKYGEKNQVKATRVSGIKSPVYEFAAMQPLPDDLRDDEIRFFMRKLPNPVSNRGLREYRFNVSGDEVIDGRNLVIISYYPLHPTSQSIKGYIWVDTEDYGVARFYGENLSDKRVAELEIDWTRYKDRWFPGEKHFRSDAGRISYPSVRDSVTADGTVILDTIQKTERAWLHLTTTFKDFESPEEFHKKEFRGYADELDVASMKESDEVLPLYRDEPLTDKERNTYIKIDSIGSKYNLDRSIKLMRIVTSGGKYEIGKIDLDLTRLFGYNEYEGFRLGIGGNTNANFSRNFSLNGYTAYGFKDKKLKYGGGVDLFVNKPYSGRIFAAYADDVEASGRSPLVLQSPYFRFITGNLDNIYNDFFYKYRKVSTGYEQDLFQNLTFRFSLVYNEQTALFDYRYRNSRPDEKFLSFDTRLDLRWAPKEKNVRTPYGKVTLTTGMPVFYLSLSQGWNLFNADYKPTKIDFNYFDRYQTFLGRTGIRLSSGAVIGKSPIMNLFEGMGNAKRNPKIMKHFGLAVQNHFETMIPGEFYSDKYFSFHLIHQIAGFRFLGNEIFPEFIYRGLIGGMKDPEQQQNIHFSVPEKYYQEAGLEFNRLLLDMLGVGFYYRFGTYAYDDFDRNFFFKLSLRLNLF